MVGVIKVYGVVSVAVGLLVLVFGVYALLKISGLAVFALVYGIGAVLTGAMLYCFGATADHLAAIRRMQERQLAIFERMDSRR